MILTIPDGVAFSDLKLARHPSGDVAFDWSPIERICEASRIDIAVFREQSEDHVGGLIVAWYRSARAAGEPADPVAEDLIAEVDAEDRLGSGISHQPGRA